MFRAFTLKLHAWKFLQYHAINLNYVLPLQREQLHFKNIPIVPKHFPFKQMYLSFPAIVQW
jgi:hypothetical protein